MCAEIPPGSITALYLSEGFSARPEAERFLKRTDAEIVSDEVFRTMADTLNPQGVLALVRQYHYTPNDLFPDEGEAALILILEHLQDPGNLGTIVRSAEGAGVSGILMDEKTADIYSPKVIRSTMGSIFRVPFVRTEDLEGDVRRLSQRGVKIYAADLKGDKIYDEPDYTGPCAYCIGNEAAGLDEALLSLTDERVRIPTLGKVESLNAAMACGVLIFEAARQRREKNHELKRQKFSDT